MADLDKDTTQSDTISVYYRYSDDINILLGKYDGSSTGGSSESGGSSGGGGSSGSGSDKTDHGSVIKSGSGYIIYSDGYYELKNIILLSSSETKVNCPYPFKNTAYTVNIINGYPDMYVGSKTTSSFNIVYPAWNTAKRITVQYEAYGYAYINDQIVTY